jgi:hypothetical protein
LVLGEVREGEGGKEGEGEEGGRRREEGRKGKKKFFKIMRQ